MPLKTRDGVADAPIEPGLRMLCEPCVFGPRWNLWRLIVPAKPLPIPIPETLIESPGSKASTVTVSPGTSSVSPRNSTRWRCAPSTPFLLQVAELRLRDLPVGDGVERELDGLVAVRLDRLHLDDRAGTGLDHRHGRDDTGLRVEDLSHSDFLSDDPFHLSKLTLLDIAY